MTATRIWVCEHCGDVWEDPENSLPPIDDNGRVMCEECMTDAEAH